MPFASAKQRAFMYARHPEIAKRWRKESGPQRGLPTYSGGPKHRGDKRDRMVAKFITKHRR